MPPGGLDTLKPGRRHPDDLGLAQLLLSTKALFAPNATPAMSFPLRFVLRQTSDEAVFQPLLSVATHEQG